MAIMLSSSERNKIFNEKVRSLQLNENEKKLFFETEKDEMKLIQMAIGLEETTFLTKELLNGNNETTEMILKHKKICRKLFQDPKSLFLNVDFLFNDFFPNASYFSRKKIIAKLRHLLKDEAKGEIIYKKLEDLYGRTTAKPILHTCSEKFVKDIFKNSNRFNYPFLDKLILKYPNLLEDEDFMKIYANSSEVPLQTTIRVMNLLPIHKIPIGALNNFITKAITNQTKEKESYSYIGFSRKKTRVLLKNYREEIIKNPIAFRRYLEKSKTLRMLSKEEFILFIKDTLNSDESTDPKIFPNYKLAFEWINWNQKNKKFETIKQMVASSMNQNWTHLTDIDHIMMIDEEIRIKLLDKKIENENFFYIHSYSVYGDVLTLEACKPCSVTLPQFKTLISKERKVEQRAKLLQLLLFSCTVNKDPASFQNIIDYVNTKFRNERFNIRESFFNGCQEYFAKNPDLVTEEHLEGIFECLKLGKSLKEDTMSYYKNAETQVLKLYIEKKEGEIPESKLAMYIKCIGSYGIGLYNERLKEKNQMILSLYFNHLKSKYEQNTKEENATFFTPHFISYTVSQIGTYFPKELTSIFEKHSWLKIEAEKVMNDVTRNDSDNIWNLLKPHKPEEVDERMIKYFKILNKFRLPISHFIFRNHKVECIQSAMRIYMEDIPLLYSYDSCALVISRLFLKMRLKGFESYDEIVQEILKHCLEIIENKKSKTIKIEKAVHFISMLSEKMFIEITNKYLPTEDKISTEEEAHHKTQIQINIAKNLKNISLTKHSNELISIIKAFCRGEYFKFCQGTVSSIVKSMKTRQREEFLLNMMKSYQISQKKLVIRLVYETSIRNEIISFLTKTLKTEKNHSILEVIASKLLNFLVEDPSEEKWSFFEEAIESFKPENLSILKTFIIRFPLQFISKFFFVSIQQFLKEINETKDAKEKKDLITNYKDFLNQLPLFTTNFSTDFFNFLIDKRKIVFHEYEKEDLLYIIFKTHLISDQASEQDIDRMFEILKIEKQETKNFTSHFNTIVNKIFMFIISKNLFGSENQGTSVFPHFQLTKKMTHFFNDQFDQIRNFSTHMQLSLTYSICKVLEELNAEERKKIKNDFDFWGKKLGEIMNEILYETLSKFGDKLNVIVVSILTNNLRIIFKQAFESKFLYRSFGQTFLTPKYPELKPELIQIFKTFSSYFEKELQDGVMKEYVDSPLLQIYNHYYFPGRNEMN